MTAVLAGHSRICFAPAKVVKHSLRNFLASLDWWESLAQCLLGLSDYPFSLNVHVRVDWIIPRASRDAACYSVALMEILSKSRRLS